MSTPESELDALEAEAEQRFADYWGGAGPDYEAQASRDSEADGLWPDAPWWDGEKLHGAEVGRLARHAAAQAEPEAEAEP